MQKITCLADAINHTPRVRVINKWDENYGNEFDITSNHYQDRTVYLDKKWRRAYGYFEIQFLTPVQYYWRYIGFGDKVNWYEVFDCAWVYWNFQIRVSRNDKYTDTTYFFPDEAHSFEPLHKLTPKIELTTEELIKELQRRGVVTEGKIINN